MDRSVKTQAIVIRTARYGELHKIVTLLSPDLGIVSAVVYGGRKGKRTALAPLFSVGTFQLYNNPVKKEYSIEEGVLSFVPTSIADDLESTYTASLMCELVMKTPSDDPQPVFGLLETALRQLEMSLKESTDQADSSSEGQSKEKTTSKRAVIAFVWKLLQISGLAPDLEYCPSCDRRYEEDETLSFSSSILAPTCRDCGDSEELVLPPGARRYLRYTQCMEYEDAVGVKLNPAAEARILNYMTKWIRLHVNAPIKTLENWPF